MNRRLRARETEAIVRGLFVRRLDARIHQRVREKLKYLELAADLRDLKIPPSNQLEALKGDRHQAVEGNPFNRLTPGHGWPGEIMHVSRA